jgi:hypothetical protein
VPPEHTAIARGARPRTLLATEQTVVLSSDPDSARQLARGFVSGYLGMPNYANNLRRLGYSDDEIGEVHDRVVDAVVVSGDVATICRRVARTSTPALTTCASKCSTATMAACRWTPGASSRGIARDGGGLALSRRSGRALPGRSQPPTSTTLPQR